jgi:hypothetical protein
MIAGRVNLLTRIVWEALLRWAHYLARTWYYVLTYRFKEGPGAKILTVHADSSLGSASDGLSYSAWSRGPRAWTGPLSTATKKSRLPLDRSGAAELIAIGDGAKTNTGT